MKKIIANVNFDSMKLMEQKIKIDELEDQKDITPHHKNKHKVRLNHYKRTIYGKKKAMKKAIGWSKYYLLKTDDHGKKYAKIDKRATWHSKFHSRSKRFERKLARLNFKKEDKLLFEEDNFIFEEII